MLKNLITDFITQGTNFISPRIPGMTRINPAPPHIRLIPSRSIPVPKLAPSVIMPKIVNITAQATNTTAPTAKAMKRKAGI